MRPLAARSRKAGSIRKPLTTTLFVVAALLLPAAAAQAGTVPSGFQESVAFSGLTEPTSVAFSPDGRVFVAEKSGIIKVFDSLNDPTPEVFADLTKEVHDFWDRGLLGMALDPQFPARPYIYVLYTLDAPPGGTAPTWGGTSPSDGCPTPPGPTTNGCVVTGRLAKLTASGDKMTAETPLITDWCQQFPSHSIGDLAFGADGSLYVSGGDGASFTFLDWGQAGEPVNPCGDPPGGVGGAMTPPTAEGGSLRSQDLRTPADPTDLNGALLRVDPETGQGLPGNPLSASPDANARRIVAYGMRNPFRFTVRPGTNEVWVGDVGLGTWEEIDRVDNPTGSTPYNFGWPCYEGANGSSARQPGWDALNVNLCESLYKEGPSAVNAPYYAYKHTATVVPEETCPTGSSSISGLAFYESGPFPNIYNGALFFEDYSRNCIWAMLPGANGLPNPANIQTFDVGAAGPVDLKVGPDGALYFADLNHGKIWRIGYTSGNQPPVAEATATPQDGPGPLNVQLSAAGSSDPNPGDTLSYSWDLNGDGQFGDSTQVSPTHVYTEPGVHVATVRVTDPDGASDTASVSIQVDNAPPTATITAPLPSLTWAVGDQIAFSGTATDPQEGTLPASAYSWNVVLHHCPSNCHLHQLETIVGKTSGIVVAPDHEYPSWLELQLTVTDSGGLTDTQSVAVYPKTVSLEVQTLPKPGFEVAIDGASGNSPFSTTVIKGSDNTIAAPAQTLGGTEYAFGAWSDGGEAAHNVIADHNLTLTAVYGPPAAPTITATSPGSPANDNNPEVSGTVGSDFPAQVKIYTSPNCSGSPAAVGTPAQFTGGGITTAVPGDATTSLSAATTNAAGSTCSKAFSYTEDSTPPAAPTIASTSPASPANNNNPKVSGSAEAGSTVGVYKSTNCSGTAASTGSAAQFAAGLTASVADDTNTTFTAKATDAAGNASGCSAALGYTEDSTAPAAPAITATSPASPANDNNPEVSGSAESGSTVRIYKSASCSGAAAATGTATQFVAGLTVSVPDNANSSLTATATDAVGNVSGCSSTRSYIEDSTAPAAPTIAATSPASPANDNNPEVSGSAEAGSTVRVYTTADCSGPVSTTGSAAQFAAGLTVAVANDTNTTFTAKATDAAGNTSPCSQTIAYTEDSTPPAAPTIATTSPASPANNNNPKVSGGAESGSTVRIYKSANCSGSAAATGSATQLAAGLTVAVVDDTNTSLTATATDAAGNTSPCSSAFSYVEDSTAPAAPAITATSPSSPANDNNPEVSGNAEEGSTVHIYKSANCSGAVAATGTPAEFAAGLTVPVADNSTTAFTATATDAAGNVSGCSSTRAYTEDSTAPAAPTIASTSPASPANDNNPEVSGNAEEGSTVRVYTTADCSGPVSTTGSAAQFAAGLTASVADDTNTTFTAKATDAAGNTSPCSQTIAYTEDSTPPAAPTIAATSPASPANDNNPEVSGSAESGATVHLYKSANCSGQIAATGSAAQFAAGLTVAVADDTDSSLTAKATDAAGNTSGCSNALSYIEDSTAPAAPTIAATSPASPANDSNPEVRGSANGGSPTQVEIYTTANCTGTPITASVATFTGAGITVTVPDNQTTVFSARARDAAGNDSTCSSTFSYVEDSTLPEAPTIASTSPASPANDNNPEVSGNAESGSTVHLYESANCSGTAAATGSATQFAAGLTVAVVDDTNTSLTATATDDAGNVSSCSEAIVYTEDSTPPSTPLIAASSPNSPANDNNPEVSGSSDGDATVRVFESANCSGPVAAMGTAAEFAAGLSLPVADDTNNSFTATATDAAGNASACSPAFHYTEDSTAPAAPTIAATNPASPANDNNPQVKGGAESGSTVRLYGSANCSGPVAAMGTPAEFAAGLTVPVADNSTTAFTATATDAAGNVSGCSSSFSYTEDSTAPQTEITRAPRAKLSVTVIRKRNGRLAQHVQVSFGFKSDDTTAHFLCKFDGAPFSPCSSPSNYTKFKSGPHRFSVRAVDLAGNIDPTPASRGFNFVEKKRKRP